MDEGYHGYGAIIMVQASDAKPVLLPCNKDSHNSMKCGIFIRAYKINRGTAFVPTHCATAVS